MRQLNVYFLLASQARLFWKTRAFFARLGFLSHRRLFGIRAHIRDSRTETATLLTLTRLTIVQVVIAILVGIVMQYIDPYFDDFYKRHGLKIAPDIYGTLLGTITFTGAVLIGLYYSATTAIGGAIYARLPNNIRDLLARERVGNVYIRQLAFLTYFGVVLLAFQAAGFAPINIAIPFFMLTSGIAIMAFVLLGARAFNLFDPTSLSYELFEQLKRNYLQMTPSGYRWLDPAFQNHAHKISRSALDTLATLADITATETHLSGQPFLSLTEQLLSFLISYEPEKKRIPTASHWYAQRFSHPDWYQTGDTETSLAYQTTSGLTPKTIGNPRWIEDEIIPIAHNFIGVAFRQRKYESITSLLRYFDGYLRALVKEHEVKSAFVVLDNLTSTCSEIFFQAAQQDQPESLERIGIVDALATMPTNMFLAYLEAQQLTNRTSILAVTNRITWKSRSRIYVSGMPLHLLTRLEWLQPKIKFEIDSEGRQVSPSWYVGELILQQLSENTKVATNAFVLEVQTTYDRWITAAANAKLIWIGAAIFARELEYWSKVKFHHARIQNYWADLGSEKRIEGLPWPTVDFEQLDRSRTQRERKLVQLMATHSTTLSLTKRPDDYPDFAGQFLHTAGEALFSAMSENDPDTINLLFPDFFRSSLLQFNRILARTSELDWRSDVAVKVAVAPVLDLIDLTGYAILFSELYSNATISHSIVNLWSDYLNTTDRAVPMSKASFLASAISLTDSAFELAHRSLIRTSWRQQVSQRLRQLERRPVSGRGRGIFWNETVVVHDSPLVRLYATTDVIMYDGIDLFIERCLRTRDDGRELQFGNRHGRLDRAMTRRQRSSQRETPK